MIKTILIGCMLACAPAVGPVAAQTFPERPVRFIVPNPPGGSNDATARALAQALSEIWAHGIVIDNRAGAGGNIGTQAAATATPDGYTYLLTPPGPMTINPSLHKKLPFDPQKDFVPIALLATVPIVLIINPKVPASNLRELVALAKEQEGAMNFASSGVGSTHHLAAVLFSKMANTRHERSDRRPRADPVRQSADRHPSRAIWNGTRHRRRQSAATAIPSRNPHLRRSRHGGFRSLVLVRPFRAFWHAGQYRRESHG